MSWDTVRARLAAELSVLADGGFIVLGEPESPPRKEKGRLWRRTVHDPDRFVQFLRIEDVVFGECVGATLFGGAWPATAAQDAALSAAGWLRPQEPGADPIGILHYRFQGRLDSLERQARMGADALAILGADPATLVWRRGP